MKKVIYSLILLLACCTSNKTSKDTNSTINPIEINNAASNQIINDSLSDFRNYFYLSNIPTRDFAELYLKDNIITNDYKRLYDCLDSLSSNNRDTRNYYFKVLIKALDNPEVVFHQKMGVYLVKNIDNFNDEFLERLSIMNNQEIVFYAQAIESYLSENSANLEKWLNKLKMQEKKSTSEQFKKVNLFFKEIDRSKNDTME